MDRKSDELLNPHKKKKLLAEKDENVGDRWLRQLARNNTWDQVLMSLAFKTSRLGKKQKI